MSISIPLSAILFDAYGTLLDLGFITERAEQAFPGHGAQLSALWRDKQLNYTWLRTIAGHYADFATVTADALDYSIERLALTASPQSRDELLAAYWSLPSFPEAAAALTHLRHKGLRLGVLSNGTPAMLEAALRSSGLDGLFDDVLSVDAAGSYKTARAAYQLGPDRLNLPLERILFVSSNGWDICGATWFGYRTFWVNRAGHPPERLGVSPNATGRSLTDLMPLFV
ncbi:haloacid dehalogenase type II [Labrys okinawensis]|uniref:(S)-2-haloacid dehalogenase n=1 Tax=Labrys okinawensis TaxID=346911 RepID=A0A2S9QCH2_9HYPH|nr:haloacid dehalogenase type II [Labrys okinawensis]PRH87046.1 haloacid dehalogenase type II [Labrys okinawensis]